MAVDSSTLYKLMALFMLNKVNHPLTNNQLSDFFLVKNYTNYFTLQEVLSDLEESAFVSTDTTENTTYYYLTPKGEETLEFFHNQIPSGIVDDLNTYLTDNNFELRSAFGTQSDYYKSTSQDYIVHCLVKEGKTNLIELNLAVPTKEDASKMCSNWKESCQEIYEYLIKLLSK
ncbi:MAG: DUF4364 family protein [Lachnospiraceae bacterium]|nr:DUF4364 family protein [Lachnospiraceae bacterium]MCR5083692.1 DUF4364 family protein [Parasporobacterium sp.]